MPPQKASLYEWERHWWKIARLGPVLERIGKQKGYSQLAASCGVPQSARILSRDSLQRAATIDKERILKNICELLPLFRGSQLVHNRLNLQNDQTVSVWNLLVPPDWSHPRLVSDQEHWGKCVRTERLRNLSWYGWWLSETISRRNSQQSY